MNWTTYLEDFGEASRDTPDPIDRARATRGLISLLLAEFQHFSDGVAGVAHMHPPRGVGWGLAAPRHPSPWGPHGKNPGWQTSKSSLF